ncbi:MAG: hypothetical protein KatS3mg101_0555 [Patescibacteria group bacterium]|nr:MAG: hypothetical protein KatS3mg101_0555 [Patescibacteria group bacterium]
MLDVFRGGKRETKWDTAEDTLDKAFRDNGVEDFDLTKVKRLEHNELPNFNEGREKGKPQIYYKQVMVEKQRNIFEKLRDRKSNRELEMIPSDQVLVIVNMNNGEKPENNTVVCMLARQKDGKLDKTDSSALNTLESEEQYLKTAGSKSSSSDSRFRRGELTTQGYRKVYKGETGHSIEDYWKDWDKNVEKTVDYHKSEKYKATLMERLNEDYTRILAETQQRKEEIINETKKRLEANKEKKRKLITDIDFTLLLENLYQIQKSGAEKDIKRMEKLRSLYSKAFSEYRWDELWEKGDLLV